MGNNKLRWKELGQWVCVCVSEGVRIGSVGVHNRLSLRLVALDCQQCLLMPSFMFAKPTKLRNVSIGQTETGYLLCGFEFDYLLFATKIDMV